MEVKDYVCIFANKTILYNTMCTITLSYNENNKAAKAKLAALLNTGLFVKVDDSRNTDIDYSDSALYDLDTELPVVSKDLSPEELEKLIIEDIHTIYAAESVL